MEQTKRSGLQEREITRGEIKREFFCNFNRHGHIGRHQAFGFWTFSRAQQYIEDPNDHFFSVRNQVRINNRLRIKIVVFLVQEPN